MLKFSLFIASCKLVESNFSYQKLFTIEKYFSQAKVISFRNIYKIQTHTNLNGDISKLTLNWNSSAIIETVALRYVCVCPPGIILFIVTDCKILNFIIHCTILYFSTLPAPLWFSQQQLGRYILGTWPFGSKIFKILILHLWWLFRGQKFSKFFNTEIIVLQYSF